MTKLSISQILKIQKIQKENGDVLRNNKYQKHKTKITRRKKQTQRSIPTTGYGPPHEASGPQAPTPSARGWQRPGGYLY